MSGPEEHTTQFGPTAPDDHGFPSSGGAFNGDFFGDSYTAEELGYISGPEDNDGQPDNQSEPDSDGSIGEENNDASRAGLEDGYEVPRPPPTHEISEDVNMLSSALPSTPAPTREVRKAAEDRFHHTPIIDKYPGNLAGKPISTTRSDTSEEQYRSSLGNPIIDNPYAPFTSKKDWEVAKWAKLRGSGSTAFSDLLNIDGVRYMICALSIC
jgi:hypothetical protein